jgi:hypothetical protein
MAKVADLERRTSERTQLAAESIPSRRDEPVQNKPVFLVLSGSLDVGQKSPAEPATRPWRALWPWAWLAVTGLVTLGWLIGIGWAAVELFQWLAD